MTAIAESDEQVRQVRIRLLHSDTIAKLRSRSHLDEATLAELVSICVERHGLHADIESKVEAHYHGWKRDPRMTLIEYVRIAR